MNEPPAARYHRSNPLNNSPLRSHRMDTTEDGNVEISGRDLR